MSRPSTATEAAKAAKDLVGSFANLRADDPKRFVASVAAVLSGYPLGVVADCVDPRAGLASQVEFLSLRAVTQWCDQRLEFYRTVANYRPPLALPRIECEPGPISDEQIAKVLSELATHFRAARLSPLDLLLQQRANGRRLRIEEVMRKAGYEE